MAMALAKDYSGHLDPRTKVLTPKVSYKGERLSDTQVSILNLLGEAMSNSEIAEVLNVSKRTVESHLVRIRDLIFKLDGYRATDRNLVLFAREMLEGYEVFLRISRDSNPGRLRSLADGIQLIEDWDEASFELDQEPVGNNVVELDQFRAEYEIADFLTEEKEIRFTNGKYYLV